MPVLWAPSGFPAVPEAPELPSIFAEWSVPENGYTSTGQLKEMNVTLYTADGEQGRDFFMEYDEFGRTISSSIDSDEWGLVRGFTYAYDIPRGQYTRTGPDGVETLMEFDVANRLTLLRRGPEDAPLIWVRYEYYANGLIRLSAKAPRLRPHISTARRIRCSGSTIRALRASCRTCSTPTTLAACRRA